MASKYGLGFGARYLFLEHKNQYMQANYKNQIANKHFIILISTRRPHCAKYY